MWNPEEKISLNVEMFFQDTVCPRLDADWLKQVVGGALPPGWWWRWLALRCCSSCRWSRRRGPRGSPRSRCWAPQCGGRSHSGRSYWSSGAGCRAEGTRGYSSWTGHCPSGTSLPRYWGHDCGTKTESTFTGLQRGEKSLPDDVIALRPPLGPEVTNFPTSNINRRPRRVTSCNLLCSVN